MIGHPPSPPPPHPFSEGPNPPLIWSTSKNPTPRESRNVEVQCKGCDDFCIGETAIPFGMRFKEHVAITRASTRVVGDHLKLSGRHTFDMSSFSILTGEEDMFKRRVTIEIGRPSKYFVGLQLWAETLIASSPQYIETFCHRIHSVNHLK